MFGVYRQRASVGNHNAPAHREQTEPSPCVQPQTGDGPACSPKSECFCSAQSRRKEQAREQAALSPLSRGNYPSIKKRAPAFRRGCACISGDSAVCSAYIGNVRPSVSTTPPLSANKQSRPPAFNRKPGKALPVPRNQNAFVRHRAAGKSKPANRQRCHRSHAAITR